MVDEELPTKQFHSYQRPEVTPHSEREIPRGLQGVLQKAGIRSEGAALDLKSAMNRIRNYASANPGKVLGGLAALVIGVGLMGKRSKKQR